MNLESLLGMQNQPSQDTKKIECPHCHEERWVPSYIQDFVCKDCSTKWKIFGHSRKAVFKDELLNKGSLLVGSVAVEPSVNRHADNTIDKEEIGDAYIEV